MFDRDTFPHHTATMALPDRDRRLRPRKVVTPIRVTETRLVDRPLTCTNEDVHLMVVAANLIRIARRRHRSWDLMTALTWAGQFIEPLVPESVLDHRVENALVLIAEHLAAQRLPPPGTVVHDLVADPCGAWAEQAARRAATHYLHELLHQRQCDHCPGSHLGEARR